MNKPLADYVKLPQLEEYREWFAPLPAEFAAEEAADMPGGMPRARKGVRSLGDPHIRKDRR